MSVTFEEAQKGLKHDLQLLIKDMDMAEKIDMQLLLSLAVGGLDPDSREENTALNEATFGVALELMSEFREAGLVKRERPEIGRATCRERERVVGGERAVETSIEKRRY